MWLWTLTFRPLTYFTISLAFSSEMPTFTLIDCLLAPLAAGWTGPTCRALSETSRRTAFSFRTSTAAFRRSSVEERTSISLSSWLMLVPVSLKSNRWAISRRAWSTAFATSGIETSETMSNEKSCLAMRGDRKSTRLNSSHVAISYAVFCLKKKKKTQKHQQSKQKKHHEATDEN